MNEKRNTFRTLKEQRLLIKSIWCYFDIHRWTQYGDVESRREGINNIDYQSRTCDSCGLSQMKVLRQYTGALNKFNK